MQPCIRLGHAWYTTLAPSFGNYTDREWLVITIRELLFEMILHES